MTIEELVNRLQRPDLWAQIKNLQVHRNCDFGGDRMETVPIRDIHIVASDRDPEDKEVILYG